jgi:hypothetical protein
MDEDALCLERAARTGDVPAAKACLLDSQRAERGVRDELAQMAAHYAEMQPEGRRVAMPLVPSRSSLEPGRQYGHEKRMSPARAARLGIRQELKGLSRSRRRSHR